MIRYMIQFSKQSNVPEAATSGDLLGTSADSVKSFTKKMIKGLKGVENIYTQHVPRLKEVLDDIVRGRLKPSSFPYLGTIQLGEGIKPREVIVYIIGGSTYEESLIVHNLNNNVLPNPSGTSILLGSCTVHNMNSFLEEVKQAVIGSGIVRNF